MPQHRPFRARIGALFLCLAGMSVLAAAPLAAQTHHFVYLSTAADRTISGFELDPDQGMLTPVAGSPFDGLPDPGAMALHPSGRFLYVLNAGAKSVSVFAIDPDTGALAEAPASPFKVEAVVGYTPKLLLVEPSGRFLYVVSTSIDLQGTITSVSYYSVDQSNGAVGPTSSGGYSPGHFTPAGFLSKPQDNLLYLVGTASPDNTNDVWIYTFELDAETADISAVNLPNDLSSEGQFAQSVAIDPQGRFLFVGRGQSAGSIDTYTITEAGLPQYSNNTSILDAQALPYALAADASGSYLYAAAAGLGILGFSVNPGSGLLTSLAGSPFGGPGVSPSSVLAADPVEEFLYFEQRPFAILEQGALDELAVLPVAGSVTGIAAANPLDAVQPITAPVAELAPLLLQFSQQTIGTASQSKQVFLSNIGSAPLTLSRIFLTGTNASEFGLSFADCSAVLPSGNGCTILITFQPASDGVRQATLTVEDDAIGSPHTVPLTGTGRLPFTFQHDGLAASVVAGQMAQYDLQLVPAPGFVGEVLLSCSGAPAGAVCDVPLSLQLDGSTHASLSVKVRTTARSAAVPLAHGPGVRIGYSRRVLAWGAVMTLVLLILIRMRPTPAAISWTRFRIHCAAAILLAWVALGLASCAGATGEGGSRFQGGIGTPAGLYELTLTATFNNAAQTVQLDLEIL